MYQYTFYNDPWSDFKVLTCRLVSLLCRLDIMFFQSSLAVFILTRTASTLSLAATLETSSPLTTTAFSFDWPCSLSLRNSWGEKKKLDDSITQACGETLQDTHVKVFSLCVALLMWRSGTNRVWHRLFLSSQPVSLRYTTFIEHKHT